ncbi:MAG TPA: glutamate racemase [Acidimicrobiia bacterium]|jgi:glutamate racemase
MLAVIGVFDSGLGGLSVLAEIRRAVPGADLLYVADRKRAPYGTRSLEEVRDFSTEIAGWLLDHGAGTVVVACNTASAASLDDLRARHPGVPIVGMEPAVKPAAERTGTGVIGVFATAATFQGRLFDTTVLRWAEDKQVMAQACPAWVELVERGIFDGPEAESMIGPAVSAALAAGADTLVLGCTHFSFLRPVISRLAGDSVDVIDPAPAVARQTARVSGDSARGEGRVTLAASGDLDQFADLVSLLGGWDDAEIVPYP